MTERAGAKRSAANEFAQAIVVVAAIAAGGWWWISRSGDSEKSGVAVRTPGAEYVGFRACRECHPGEDARQRRSGHSRTLAVAGSSSVARRLNGQSAADPEFPSALWTYLLRDGTLSAERTEPGKHPEPHRLDYAVGSGLHAVSFLEMTGRDAENRPLSIEHRLTYFENNHALGVTPGQTASENDQGRGPEGRRLTAESTMKCLGCHATRLSAADERNVDPATLIPNVTCERCHGPARAHIAAARRGDDSALAMPFGYAATETAERNVRLCGQCHRLPEHVPAKDLRPDKPMLARFQPVGLMQSRCYTQSRGALSCSNCHDPHAPTSRDTLAYETVCLSCHATPARTACPVNARAKCLECHMPKRDTGNGMMFSDHWIRAERR